jgi:hypothetical protein
MWAQDRRRSNLRALFVRGRGAAGWLRSERRTKSVQVASEGAEKKGERKEEEERGGGDRCEINKIGLLLIKSVKGEAGPLCG